MDAAVMLLLLSQTMNSRSTYSSSSSSSPSPKQPSSKQSSVMREIPLLIDKKVDVEKEILDLSQILFGKVMAYDTSWASKVRKVLKSWDDQIDDIIVFIIPIENAFMVKFEIYDEKGHINMGTSVLASAFIQTFKNYLFDVDDLFVSR